MRDTIVVGDSGQAVIVLISYLIRVIKSSNQLTDRPMVPSAIHAPSLIDWLSMVLRLRLQRC